MVGIEEDSPELEDERRVRVTSVLPRKGARLVYRYDYGDDWEHVVEVEDVTNRDRRLSYPVCIAGARGCPPEDCGGALGYEELITALADPKHDEHDDSSAIQWRHTGLCRSNSRCESQFAAFTSGAPWLAVPYAMRTP